MFNVRPNAFRPWLYVKPPSDDPPGFRVAADGSSRDAGANDSVSGAASANILDGGYRPGSGNPFYFLDRRGPEVGPMPFSDGGSLSPYATSLLFPRPAELEPLWSDLQAYSGELDGRPDAPSPGFHVEPPVDNPPGFRVAADASVQSDLLDDIGRLMSFEYNPKADIAPHIGIGSTPRFLPTEDSRRPFSFLNRKSSDAGSASGKPNSPYASVLPWPAAPSTLRVRNSAGSEAFHPLIYSPLRDDTSLGSFRGNLSGPAAPSVPMLPGIPSGAFGRQSPSTTFPSNPSTSSLLPVGGQASAEAMPVGGLTDGYRYVQNRPAHSIRGVRGVDVDDGGHEILVKSPNGELDPFEKLKQRGYPKPQVDPGNGSAMVTKLRKDYSQHHPSYHRYEFRDVLCDLGAQGCSVEAAYEALLRHAVPGGLASGVPIENGQMSPVSFKGVIPGGHIQTFVEPESRSIINRTLPNHPFHNGFVQRQIVVENGKVYVRTFGEGINGTPDKATANRIMAKSAFEDSTAGIRATLFPPDPPKAGQKWPR